MSFDKHYPNRKDWRKPFRKANRFDRSCRCHGSCDYCRSNRQIHDLRKRLSADEQLKEYRNSA